MWLFGLNELSLVSKAAFSEFSSQGKLKILSHEMVVFFKKDEKKKS